jgi:hypothetical protein
MMQANHLLLLLLPLVLLVLQVVDVPRGDEVVA